MTPLTQVPADVVSFDLFTAANLGDEYLQELLRAQSCDVNAQNHGGWTALMYAAHNGHTNSVKLLLCAGANTEVRDYKRQSTALMLAASCGQDLCASVLVKAGAKIDAVDNTGLTALFHASKLNHTDCVKLLLSMGANPNLSEPVRGFTPFLIACKEGHEMCVQHFLNFGCDLTSKTIAGETARTLCMQQNDMKILSMLDGPVVSAGVRSSANGLDLMAGPNAISSLMQNIHVTRPQPVGNNQPHCVIDPVHAFMDQFRMSDIDLSRVNVLPAAPPLPSSVAELLESLQLQKYQYCFDCHDISEIYEFLQLSDSDLKEIGIKLLGPRKKLLNAAQRLIAQCPPISDPIEQAYANFQRAFALEQERKCVQISKELETTVAALDSQRLCTENTTKQYEQLRLSIQACERNANAARKHTLDALNSCKRVLQSSSASLNDNELHSHFASIETNTLQTLKHVDNLILECAKHC